MRGAPFRDGDAGLGHQDHPRGCGEHLDDCRRVSVFAGSSPRMRGAPRAQGWAICPARIIPADAGSTRPIPRLVLACGDHPRGCGEHLMVTLRSPSYLGSSPRMRGAPYSSTDGVGHHGIIPADAGSTEKLSYLNSVDEDHPRGCGEHSLTTIQKCTVCGSSPRMRGARVDYQTDLLPLRIIPADAGSTDCFCRESDQPAGSSPRMRGARPLPLFWIFASGIIPADAGSTPTSHRSARRMRDHPRGCGEHTPSCQPEASREGSSPRMRGALRSDLSSSTRQRIIPADAGSTTVSKRLMIMRKDHPRGCGEHSWRILPFI